MKIATIKVIINIVINKIKNCWGTDKSLPTFNTVEPTEVVSLGILPTALKTFKNDKSSVVSLSGLLSFTL